MSDTPSENHTPPPIPRQLEHLPVVGGLAVPWITPQLPDGRYLFGVLEETHRVACLTGYRCQICGYSLGAPTAPPGTPVVLLLREQDLRRRLTAEPAVHPWCAFYAQRACPMVGGRMTHYRATPADLRGAAEHADDTPHRLGTPAEAWFAAWLPRYDVVTDPLTKNLAASFKHIEPSKVREISRPRRPEPSDVDQIRRQMAALMALLMALLTEAVTDETAEPRTDE